MRKQDYSPESLAVTYRKRTSRPELDHDELDEIMCNAEPLARQLGPDAMFIQVRDRGYGDERDVTVDLRAKRDLVCAERCQHARRPVGRDLRPRRGEVTLFVEGRGQLTLPIEYLGDQVPTLAPDEALDICMRVFESVGADAEVAYVSKMKQDDLSRLQLLFLGQEVFLEALRAAVASGIRGGDQSAVARACRAFGAPAQPRGVPFAFLPDIRRHSTSSSEGFGVNPVAAGGPGIFTSRTIIVAFSDGSRRGHREAERGDFEHVLSLVTPLGCKVGRTIQMAGIVTIVCPPDLDFARLNPVVEQLRAHPAIEAATLDTLLGPAGR